MDLGFYSYLSATLGFGFLAVMLLFSWRSSLQGRLLTIVVIVSVVWAGVAAATAYLEATPGGVYLTFEVLRYVAWFAFLLKLFEPAAKQLAGYRFLRRWGMWLSLGFAALLLISEIGIRFPATTGLAEGLLPARLTGHLLLAMTGLALIEQLFRNIAPEYRYNLKFLFIGAGGIFAYDFYLYANALLFMGIDLELWEARGFINLISVPLLTIAAARNRDWSPNIFVSRDIVFYTTTVVGGGLLGGARFVGDLRLDPHELHDPVAGPHGLVEDTEDTPYIPCRHIDCGPKQADVGDHFTCGQHRARRDRHSRTVPQDQGDPGRAYQFECGREHSGSSRLAHRGGVSSQ